MEPGLLVHSQLLLSQCRPHDFDYILSCLWMSSINSIFGSSFNWSFDLQGFSSRAMENHNHHSHSRSRERSPHERSSRDSNREERNNLKDNSPENIQDCHHFPHLVPREAECLPASQAEVLKIHNDRILL